MLSQHGDPEHQREREHSHGIIVPPLSFLPVAMILMLAFQASAENNITNDHSSQNGTLILQHVWDLIRVSGGDSCAHVLFPALLGLTSFILACIYFTIKDLRRDMSTKTQPDHWPTNKELVEVAVPQIIIYFVANYISWYLIPWRIDVSAELVEPILPISIGWYF